MNEIRTLSDKFLSTLSHEQQGMIVDYYRILTGPEIPHQVEAEYIDKIWTDAENDPVLLAWLEAIDILTSRNFTKKEEHEINDRRAYLSEHISQEIGLTEDYLPLLTDDCKNQLYEYLSKGRSVTLLLRCPHGLSHVFVSINGDKPVCQERSLSRLCQECNVMLHEHQVIALTSDTIAI